MLEYPSYVIFFVCLQIGLVSLPVLCYQFYLIDKYTYNTYTHSANSQTWGCYHSDPVSGQ